MHILRAPAPGGETLSEIQNLRHRLNNLRLEFHGLS